MSRVLIIAAAIALTGCSGTRVVPPGVSSPTADSAARQILLTVREENSIPAGLTGAPNKRYLHRRYGPTPVVDRTLNQLARDHGLQRVDGWPIRSLDVYCEVFEVSEDASVDEILASVASDPRVDLAQRMNIFETETTRYDDPYADLQAGAVQLEVEQAHHFATGRDVLIAIIDSGIDAAHPDLRGRVSMSRNLVDSRKAPRGEIHGTAVAGIIGSAVNNHEGIIGVAPDVRIAALRACWPVTATSATAQCSSFSLAQALEVALGLEARVVNMSLAGPADPLLSRLLDQVLERGIVVVTAEPHDAKGASRFPSSHPRVIVAHSSLETTPESSPYRLGAPATEVLTTTPGASYAFLSGNSLAAAHTTGVVALLMEREPTLDVERITALLSGTMTGSTAYQSINACRALDRLTGNELCARAAELARFSNSD
jgi:subtilisin family serine protease